jgi:hypothetical protein
MRRGLGLFWEGNAPHCSWMLCQYYVTLMAQYLEKCLINNVKFNSVLACTSYSSVWDCIGRLLLRWQNRAGTELAEVSRDTGFYSVWLGELWEFLSFLDFRGWAAGNFNSTILWILNFLIFQAVQLVNTGWILSQDDLPVSGSTMNSNMQPTWWL